jgi:carboxymethylenebutenolidase
MKTQWIELNVAGKTMGAYLALPDTSQKAPVIFVLQEAFGVNAHMRDVTERFAREGFIAISPELFHRTAPHGFEASYTDLPTVMPHVNAVTPETLKPDLTAVYEFLKTLPQADLTKIASIGYCMGGRATFYANSFLDLKAAISYYGGGIAQKYLQFTKDQKAPILLCWGGKDTHILPEHIHAVEAALKKENKSFVNVVFGDADHGFNCDARAQYHAPSAAQAWKLTLEFLKNNLN